MIAVCGERVDEADEINQACPSSLYPLMTFLMKLRDTHAACDRFALNRDLSRAPREELSVAPRALPLLGVPLRGSLRGGETTYLELCSRTNMLILLHADSFDISAAPRPPELILGSMGTGQTIQMT